MANNVRSNRQHIVRVKTRAESELLCWAIRAERHIFRSMTEKGEKPSIGILTLSAADLQFGAQPSPLGGLAVVPPLSNLIDVVYPNAGALHLITGKQTYKCFKEDERISVSVFHVRRPRLLARVRVLRALRFAYVQLKAAYILARIGKRVDKWIFFINADILPLATLVARLIGLRTFLFLAGAPVDPTPGMTEYPRIAAFLINVNCKVAHHIILYSSGLIERWNLRPYKGKVVTAHEHFLDSPLYRARKTVGQRANVVGYVGRLSREKGILNFIEAIPGVIAQTNDVQFVIVGDGDLGGHVNAFLNRHSLGTRVTLTGWVKTDDLPIYLNTLKLLVIPSYTEGLPHSMLEAMACGTPVLASPVGAIPDVIRDQETGFLLWDNSPAYIAQQIAHTLSEPNLEQVSINAFRLIEEQFSYHGAVKIWASLLNAY